MRILRILLAITPILFIVGCKTKEPVRPAEQCSTFFEERLSVINIPVDISLQELERSLNQQMNGSFTKIRTLTMGTYAGTGGKRQDIRLGIDSQLIKYRVPLSLWIQYDLGISKVEA